MNRSLVDRELIKALRQLAVSGGGLVRDEHRQIVWPLLGEWLEDSQLTASPSSSSDEQTSSESDYESAKSSVADEANDPAIPLIELGEPTIDDLKTHSEWRQVEMDVYRTLTRLAFCLIQRYRPTSKRITRERLYMHIDGIQVHLSGCDCIFVGTCGLLCLHARPRVPFRTNTEHFA